MLMKRLFTSSIKSIALVWIYGVFLLLLMGLATYAFWFFDGIERQAVLAVCAHQQDDQTFSELKEVLLRAGAWQVEIESVDAAYCPNDALEVTYTEQTAPFWRSRVEPDIAAFMNEHELEYFTSRAVYKAKDRPLLNWAPTLLLLVLSGLFLAYQRKRARFIQSPQVAGGKPFLLAIGLGAAVSLYTFAFLYFWLLQTATGQVPQSAFRPDSFGLGSIFLLVVLLPIFEEIAFRAWLLEAWRKLMHPALALVFSAIAFSAFHPAGPAENVFYFVFGVIIGLVWLRTRSLLACSVAHGGYNLLVLLTAMSAA